MARARRELLAAPAEVWAFLTEPHNLAEWWPGVVAVAPDRRGFAPGARWQVQRREPQLGLLRLPSSPLRGRPRSETLVIGALTPGSRWEWQLVPHARRGTTAAPLRVSLALEAAAGGRSVVTLELATRAWRGASDRAAARAALARLHALLQTAAHD